MDIAVGYIWSKYSIQLLTLTLSYLSDWCLMNFFVLFLTILGLCSGLTAMAEEVKTFIISEWAHIWEQNLVSSHSHASLS